MSISASAGADPLLEAQRQLFPPLRNPMLARAAEALAARDIDSAEPLVSKYLKRDPKSADALNLMADIARRSGRLEEAEELLLRCVERSPQCSGYRYNYALALKARGKLKEALGQFDELLDKELKNPLFRDQKAKILSSVGGWQAEALEYRRALTEDYPHFAPFWSLYGDALRGVGDQSGCILAYRKAVALDSSLTDIYLRLSDLKTYTFSPEEIRQMETQLLAPGMTSEARSQLHFALGKAYGDMKEHAKSFDNYLRGNALRRLTIGANSGAISTLRTNCEAVFTSPFFSKRAGWGFDSNAPIFIVGLPRSGSTLLEQILSSHSAIEGLGEIPELERVIIGRLTGATELDSSESGEESMFESQSAVLRAYARIFAELTAENFRAMGEEYVAGIQARRKSNAPFFVDKALHNFGHCGLIQLMLPNAKIIDTRRHPLACGWSCFTNYFPTGMRFSYRLDDIGRHYATYVRVMAHFDRVLPGKVHRVIYEELIADPEGEVRRLLDYLGLPFEEQCLRFHENKRSVRTLSSEQVRQPLYKSSQEQWVPYEPWLGPLKAELGTILDQYPVVPGEPESSTHSAFQAVAEV